MERRKSTSRADGAKEAAVFAHGLGAVVRRGWMSKQQQGEGLGNGRPGTGRFQYLKKLIFRVCWNNDLLLHQMGWNSA